MKILLDTHAFIWFVEDDYKLSGNLKTAIEKPANSIFLSIASIWEMAIKMQLNKLHIDKPIKEVIDLVSLFGFEMVPILPQHIIKLTNFVFHHRDPFDRIIIAQGLSEGMIIISKDEVFDKYGVNRIWNDSV